MRVLEIASAEEQNALRRLVSNTIWATKLAPKTPNETKTKSKKGRGSRDKAMKNVLRSLRASTQTARVPTRSAPTKPDANRGHQPTSPA